MRLHVLFASSIVLAASAARAQTPPSTPPQDHPVAIETPPVAGHTGDTVVLKDGTTLHGTIREMTPGQNVTITMQDGQTRTIEWSAVERVDIDRAKPPAAPPAPVDMTTLHLDGMRPGLVVQALDQHGTEGTWQTVCEGACDRALPTNGLYRVDGPGLRTSKPFRISGQSAVYRVDTATGLGFAAGLSLTILGGLALVNGIALFILDAAYTAEGFIVADGVLIAGVALSVGGLAALIPGIYLMKTNGRTTVSAAADGSLPARIPAWQQPQLPSLQPRYAGFGVPLWSGTF